MRRDQIQLFKTGQREILIATAAVEEGVDISSVGVVMFNDIYTSKEYIQRSGRARSHGTKIYHFPRGGK